MRVCRFLSKWAGLALSAVALFFTFTYQLKRFDLTLPAAWTWTGLAVLGLLAAVWQKYEEKWPSTPLNFGVQLWLRFFLAYVFAFYAAGKIFNLQFRVDPEVLNQRVSELTGFWKAWVFFGHSYGYGLVLAGVELAAAALLLSRRTQTVGAALYVGVMVNITAMDFFHGVEVMVIPAVLFLTTALYVLVHDAERLWRFALNQPVSAREYSSGLSPAWERRVLTGALLVLAVMVWRDAAFFHAVSKTAN